MLIRGKLINNLARGFHTSSKYAFKFKLTEEMSRDFEQKQKEKLAAIKPPVLAAHTRQSSLIMGKVSSDRYKDVIKVGVPKHRFNDFLTLYIRENDNVEAYDEKGQCKPGDWVLLRRTQEPLDENVNHKVERVVYKYGNYVDPITGRRSLGIYFEDDLERLEKIKLDN